MNKFFAEANKNFGFGCMRMPNSDGRIDIDQVCQMTDEFLANGFNYFDTARGYHDEMSEPTVKRCLTSRYPRESYVLTDKLSDNYFHTEQEIRPGFELQLQRCGVEYFDFYLMHAQHKRNYEQYRRCRAYETAFELKAQGKVKHVGISFHDSAEFLDKILTDFPELDVVQLQLNYLDWDDPGIQSRACYEVCAAHNKPVIVMEPVRGGKLADLPPAADSAVRALGVSPANLALRFAASLPNVFMVISGMSDLAQMRENISTMKDFVPVSEREKMVADTVAAIIRGENVVPCTACRYCVAGCPKHIPIPDVFAKLNDVRRFGGELSQQLKSAAAQCVACGKCESSCPQHLAIRELLALAAK